MRFTYFTFKNFKGIENQTLDFSKNHNSKIFTLVGLNESGKTTILEAMNYFIHKPESLDALKLESYGVDDIHNLIPINKRDNFNDNIVIEAGLELDEDDLTFLKEQAKDRLDITLTNTSAKVSYTQQYFFKNSIHQTSENKNLWTWNFKGKKGKSIVEKTLTTAEAGTLNIPLRKRMPSILYFPNFLFEFPEKIYLDPEIEDAKHKFFQTIIQDVLDSLGNDTNISEHLIDRIKSSSDKEKRNLNSLIGKMQKQLTLIIFEKWNQIFNKELSTIEIILYTGEDSMGPFIEFNIKDDVDTYRIVERSLGFRWFFVYILLTQFRSYRKKHNSVFFLFDEPASNLHPAAQLELLKSFELLPRVLYTTHSHYLINPKWLENTYVVKNEAINYNKEEDYKLRNTNIKIHKYREFAVNHPNQSSYFQPILEVLNYRPSNLELVPQVVITEGKNDYYAYNYLQKVIQKGRKPLKIVPGTSSSNLETLISLYLGWGSSFLVLLDSDKEGLKQKLRYTEVYGTSISDRIITYEDIDESWKNTETESLFDDVDKLSIQATCYPESTKYEKKIFNKSIQELYIKNEFVLLSDVTLKNFQRSINFLTSKLKS